MRSCTCFMLIIITLWSTSGYSDALVTPLKLYKALFVHGPGKNQPSGLTFRNDTLYAVSDKHDSTIFKITLTPDAALMRSYLHIEIPKISDSSNIRKCDFEGITCDGKGNFYLVSESCFRILRVTADGKESSWLTPSLESAGKKQGLFTIHNAYFEGISIIAPGRFILCAERQPRGFMELDITQTPIMINAYQSDESIFEFPNRTKPDFSGLYWEGNTLYVLERNAHLICKLTGKNGRFEESEGWSYKHIVTQPCYAYMDMRYGKAEGLCMDANYIYIILDNNGIPRHRKLLDQRPLLCILHRPDIKK